MKWINKGHEYDEYASNIVEQFKKKGKLFYIFGAGIIGNEISKIIEKTGCFSGFIDNDKRKQGSVINGTKIISIQEYLGQGKKGFIIIAADKKNIPAIEEQLIDINLKKNEDYFEYSEFMGQVFPILSVYANNQLYTEIAQISLTERCSLKCRKCAHGCYAVSSDNNDMSLKMAEKSVDFLFHYVDIIREFVLIGGEPFLYKEIGKIIEYIGEKYRNKMIMFSITTNGTIIPNKDILKLCKKYEITIRISNYSSTLKHLERKYKRLAEELDKAKVSYMIHDKENEWFDYGFETVDRNGIEKELLHVFDNCKTPCREVRGSRYYFCVMARSVSENLKFNLGEKDYLELADFEKVNKKVFLEFHRGFSEKGYLDMCNHCYGAEAVNYPIPPAEQVI